MPNVSNSQQGFMRDAIILSTWAWETFNVPERIALSLTSQGSRVLYCEMPVSRFRRTRAPVEDVAEGVHRFGPEYFGARFNSLRLARNFQWRMVAKQILAQSNALHLNNPLFLYSHIEGISALCEEMRKVGLPLVHICMDYPEPYQYGLIELSDLTLVIPKSVFRELRARYEHKVQWIPQSIYLPRAQPQIDVSRSGPDELLAVPRPRLGYVGPIFARLNLTILCEVLGQNPNWHFVYFGKSDDLRLPNAHGIPWSSPEALPQFVTCFDAGFMPYDCAVKKNLHCSPLKLYDYFLAGLPVVATPILELSEFADLIYVGETARELSDAVSRALAEPCDSPKRALRMDVAQSHSTEALARRLDEVLSSIECRQGKAQ
jgi:hypothetical protein